MSLKQQVLKGGTALVVRQGLGMLLSLISVLLITRTIGRTAFGTYATVLGLFGYLVLVGQLGMGVYVVRRQEDTSERELNIIFTLLLVIGLVLGGGAALLSPLIATWIHNPAVAPVGVVMFVGLPMQIVLGLSTALQDRQMNYQRVAFIDLVGQALYVVVAVPLAFLHFGVWSVVAGWWVQLLWSAVMYLRAGQWRPRVIWDRAEMERLVRYGVAYSSSLWVWQLRSLVNPVVVARLLGPDAVAVVSLTMRIVDILAFAKGVAWRVAVAALGRLQNNAGQMVTAIERGMQMQVLAVGIPMVGFTCVAPFVIERLFGPHWAAVTTLFPFVAMGVLANSLFNLHSSALYVLKHNWQVTIFHVVHVVLFAGSALILVPRLGVVGYGWAEVAALPSYAVVHLILVRYLPGVRLVLPLIWTTGLALALFFPLVGWPAFIPALVAAVLPYSWRGLMNLLRSMREGRYGTAAG